MTIGALVVLLLVLFVVGLAAYWIITKFFTAEPARTIALVVVGVILLAILLSQVFPGAANFRLFRSMIGEALAQTSTAAAPITVTPATEFLGVPVAIWNTIILAIIGALVTWFQKKNEKKVNDIHTLVNGTMGAQLKIGMDLSEFKAMTTKTKVDIEAARIAREKYEKHAADEAAAAAGAKT